MKCRYCNACVKGYFAHVPDKYVCTGVRESFIIDDLESECTAYPYRLLTDDEEAFELLNKYKDNIFAVEFVSDSEAIMLYAAIKRWKKMADEYRSKNGPPYLV